MSRIVTVTCLQQTISYEPSVVLEELVQLTKAENQLLAVFQAYRDIGHDLTEDTATGLLSSFKCGQADAVILAAVGVLMVSPL
jgi:hypothetical protein